MEVSTDYELVWTPLLCLGSSPQYSLRLYQISSASRIVIPRKKNLYLMRKNDKIFKKYQSVT